ncbi:MAG: isoamylase early set domain-containing protein [Anaerolineae bacterium]|nr:isoamylase early set domain-containing protein [Anaerolineae bacterium]
MLTKKFFKSKPTCQVTFELPKNIEAKQAALAGDFNNWDTGATPLKKMKGIWKVNLELEPGREYQFRYFVNGSEWHNDEAADKYVPNNVDGDNSVVVT